MEARKGLRNFRHMTPKEKALALIQEFIDSGFLPMAARIGALITVDEILNTLFGTLYGYSLIEYWNEVKKEIEEF